MKEITRKNAIMALVGGAAGVLVAPAVAAAPVTEEQVKNFLRGFDNEENLSLHLAGMQFRSAEKLEKQWDAGIFAPPCPPSQPEPIDTTDNPFSEVTFSTDATDAQVDLLDWLNNGKPFTFLYDDKEGEKLRADPEYDPEEEAESRIQWEQAHRALAQQLIPYLERFL